MVGLFSSIFKVRILKITEKYKIQANNFNITVSIPLECGCTHRACCSYLNAPCNLKSAVYSLASICLKDSVSQNTKTRLSKGMPKAKKQQ